MGPQYSEHKESFDREFWQGHDEALYGEKQNESHRYKTTNDYHVKRDGYGNKKYGKDHPFRPIAYIL